MVREVEAAQAGLSGQGDLADRDDQGSRLIDAIEPEDKREPRLGVGVFRERIEPVPEPLDQLAGQPKAVAQPGEALQSNQGLDQVGGDFQVFGFLGQDLRPSLQDGAQSGDPAVSSP